jgi:5-methylcytosine-specific restriction endonuclease McrA
MKDPAPKTWMMHAVSRLSLTRIKIYRTVARQLHGIVPCWVCGQPVAPDDATLEHITPLSEGGSSHLENLAISHGSCNNRRHAKTASDAAKDAAPP